ncbi:tyrosine-protein phosphatase [Phenylobacterium sp. J367]|uniref:tyrosine-protein phosphatase n=1 Tax=Phenylobacterium sp. J367 TaxID=2898435 RepID=UPI0021510A6D|nr:tyrosine-protein phosphatase [Phenylobacterium sp. J367]MCR5877722.1 tyrosine-protein phosphatase [Phenylobacterium sp. J367]
MSTRRIAFEGIDNFRDFGDYAAGQRRLHKGRLYRSAHQARATDADLEKLAALGISVIIDLRRANERERDPSRRWQGFAAQVVDNDIGQDRADPWHEFLKSSDLSEPSFTSYMLDYYDAAPHEARHIDLYRRYFHALAESERPILVHCAAGKDRTGIICALTHHLAGVHADDIAEDFLLTNDPERIAARTPVLQELIRAETGRTPSEGAVRVAMSVAPEYLERAFAVMRDRHGSIDGYLADVLGLDAALRDRIHDRILG